MFVLVSLACACPDARDIKVQLSTISTKIALLFRRSHSYFFHLFSYIINNDANHKNYDTTMHQSYSTYFHSIGKKIHTLPRCGLVKIQVARHIYVPLGFGVVLIGKVCFLLPAQFCKAVDFTPALLYPNFKLQY